MDLDYGLWPLVIINSLVLIFFAGSFFHPRTKRDWRAMGAYSAFIVALFTEMYGVPLTIYLLSGWLGSRFPALQATHSGGHFGMTSSGGRAIHTSARTRSPRPGPPLRRRAATGQRLAARTEWLRGTVASDERGFVLTDRDVPAHAWSKPRPPLAFETSAPGVFAVGDVRHASVKRAAGAVGEGSVAVGSVLQYLGEKHEQPAKHSS